MPQTVPPFSVSDPEDIGYNITEAVEPAVILQGVGAGDAAAIVAGGEGAAVRLIGVVGGVIAPAPAGVLRNGVFAHRKLIDGDTAAAHHRDLGVEIAVAVDVEHIGFAVSAAGLGDGQGAGPDVEQKGGVAAGVAPGLSGAARVQEGGIGGDAYTDS